MNNFETKQKYIYNEEEFEIMWKKFENQYKGNGSSLSQMKNDFKNICISVSSNRYTDAFNSWVEIRMNPYLRNFIQLQGFKAVIITNKQLDSEKQLIFIPKEQKKETPLFKPEVVIQNEVEQIQNLLNSPLNDAVRQCMSTIQSKNGKFDELKKNLEDSLNQKRIINNWIAARILNQTELESNIKNNIIKKGFSLINDFEQLEEQYKPSPLYILINSLKEIANKNSYQFILKNHNIPSNIALKEKTKYTQIYSYKLIAKNSEGKRLNFYIDILIDYDKIIHFYYSKISKQCSIEEIVEQIINDMNKLNQQ